MLHFQHVGAAEHRPQIFQLRRACFRAQNLALRVAIGIAHAHAHQKAVQLRLGQRIRSVMLDGILRGNHQKRLRQRIGMGIHRDLAFVHGFQQARIAFLAWCG